MRYFNSTASMQDIVSEAFNIEAGKEYCKNNKLVYSKNTNLYPEFDIDGVITNIRSNMGFIFLPSNLIENFTSNFMENIINMESEFETMSGFNHLQTYSALETGSDHYTLLKAKNRLEITSTETSIYNIIKRRIYININDEKLEKIAGMARFTWVVYSIDQFVMDLVNFNKRKIPISCQLVSIMYDPYRLVNLNNGETYIDNLTFKNFYIYKNLLNICTYGEINSEFTSRNKSNKNAQPLISDISEYCSIPEYMPAWHNRENRILLCEKRKGAFEIIRHLGNWSIFQNSIYIPLHKLLVNVYIVDYKNIVIDNIDKSNTICSHCDTPLYDNIYVLFKNPQSNIGKSYCAVCMHCNFDEHGTAIQYENTDGYKIYSDTDILARTVYPVTVAEIINKINTDIIVKEILALSFSSMTIEYNENLMLYTCLIIGSKKYIGWLYDLDTYVFYTTKYMPDHLAFPCTKIKHI